MRPKIYHEAEFRANIKEQIDQGRHIEYFKAAIKQFDYYQKVFDDIFAEPNEMKKSQNTAHVFLVEYTGTGGGGDEILATREFEILGYQTFETLAKHIVLSMGWVYDHMHGYDLLEVDRLPDPHSVGSALTMFASGWEDDPYPAYKTSEICVADINYNKQQRFELTFDYGDGHTFTVTFNGYGKIDPEDNPLDFPRLMYSSGQAPEQYTPIDEE